MMTGNFVMRMRRGMEVESRESRSETEIGRERERGRAGKIDR